MTRNEAAGGLWLWPLAVLGLGAGLATVRLAEMPGRWVIAFLIGLVVLAAALVSGRLERAPLFVFVFSLQIGLALYLTAPPARPSVGASWPNSLAVPLSSLMALAALALRPARKLLWGRGTCVCTGLLILTTAASLLSSPFILIGVSHLVVLLAYFCVYLAAANAVSSRADLDLVLRILMASLVLQSLIYFAQSLVGATFTPAGEWITPSGDALGRYGGTAGPRPAAFSSFLLPLLLLAVSHFLAARDRGARLRYGLLAAVGSGALMLTFTRAAWIGFALGLAYLLAARMRRRLLVGRNVAVLLIILLVVTLALLPRILMRVGEDYRAALEERWALVRMALQVIEANPLMGAGAGAYPYVFRDYLTSESADRWLYVVHNVYLLRAAETGLPGLVAWLAFLWVAFRQAAPERMVLPALRPLALGWRAGLVALAWEMLWDVTLGPAANSLLWFLCGLMGAAARMPPARAE